MILFRLIDACCEAYDNPDFFPRNGSTYCNWAVHFIAGRMGFSGFAGLMANQIVAYMRVSPKFQKIEIPEAQEFANQGKLVIAGIVDEPHGHVVVIRPGEEVYSPKWGCKVPKVVNIGSNNFINNPLSWVMRDKPDVFVFKDELEG